MLGFNKNSQRFEGSFFFSDKKNPGFFSIQEFFSPKKHDFYVLCACFFGLKQIPRDPGSPKLRMGAWNLNTLRFVSVIRHPESSSSDVR